MLIILLMVWLLYGARELLTSLENCSFDPAQVADCFVRHNDGFVVYSNYCTNYPKYTMRYWWNEKKEKVKGRI